MMKKIRLLSLILSVALLISCIFASGITASAAYVTDGDKLYTAGDVNGDGEINVLDLVCTALGTGSLAAADLDGNNEFGSYDCALVRAIILGIDKSQWTE